MNFLAFKSSIRALTLGLGLVFFDPSNLFAWAQSQSFAATAQVPVGAYRAVRLNGVPQGARIDIEVRLESQLRVLLLSEAEAKRLPHSVTPVAAVTATGDVVLTTSAPETGSYFVVLDNRQGKSAQAIAVSVTVILE